MSAGESGHTKTESFLMREHLAKMDRTLERIDEELVKLMIDVPQKIVVAIELLRAERRAELVVLRNEFKETVDSGVRTRNGQIKSVVARQNADSNRIMALERKTLISETKRGVYMGILVGAGSVGGTLLTLILQWLLK